MWIFLRFYYYIASAAGWYQATSAAFVALLSDKVAQVAVES